MLPRFCFALAWLGMAHLAVAADPPTAVADKVLFDFEGAEDVKAWSLLQPPDVKAAEPPVKLELSAEHATSGKQSLKVTYAGGEWPTISTAAVPDDWAAYKTIRADVTVSRPCLIGFVVLQEKSSRNGNDWGDLVGRWTKTALLQPGRNEVVGAIKQPNDYAISRKYGKVVRLEFFLYHPHAGESVHIDNIRLSGAAAAEEAKPAMKVFGTDLTVSDAMELGKKIKDKWAKPALKSLDDVESEFRAQYEEIKKTHARAVMAILRDGEKGWDPANPDKAYDGWKDAHMDSHGPDGNLLARSRNTGKVGNQEMFMRHRSALMRVDLSSIPKGAEVLAARLVVVRGNPKYDPERNPELKANVWVAEPCNRPWEEYEVNAYEYAKDKFWKAVGGRYYGEDPDFLPMYFLLGPGGGPVSAWDFTAAVKFWTDGTHANYGFMLHSDPWDYIGGAHYRESKETKKRPTVIVVYEPRPATK